MAWEQLSINKPHLAYLILGGFTSLFMLCSSVIKEKLYIGEATVATLCGIIFGPHAAGLIDPGSWGNTDQITLEFSRIVLVVQCFAVGVELPKAYMERHWKSVAFFLIPVMTFGYLVTSLFIWGLIPGLDWLDSLVIAACVTATDPVLASSVVGKGKFAKRVPKHIRDVLSAESGCNDGMAFPFIYLGLYIIKYRYHPNEVALHWICITILYECVFGAVYGFIIGYLARRAIRYAHEKNFIDRESFLVFYFVLALFCAGSGSLLGMDDLLIGFACGVGFSNDGWFTAETEESHVSNVIDLLINLAFFVYFGAIIPWEQFNAEHILGLTAWRLAVLGILVLLFRRIPIVVALKPFIPDVKTWREAFFCGHFGPIGVGALFVAILARAELETGETTPLADLPEQGFPHLNIIELIWPVTCFLVMCSIIVHGSSIAVFSLGRHINTLTLTMSYTQGNDSSWMERLPRIQSRSKTSMSRDRLDDMESAYNEKVGFPPGVVPKNFLRRQREDDAPSRASSRKPLRRKKDSNYGGPISQSAITPTRQNSDHPDHLGVNRSDSDTLAMKSDDSPDAVHSKTGTSTPSDEAARDGEQVYEEGDKTVYEDRDGEVLEVEQEEEGQSESKRRQHEKAEANHLAKEESQHGVSAAQNEGERATERKQSQDAAADEEGPSKGWRKGFTMASIAKAYRDKGKAASEKKPEEKRGPARAYQYGNTIIVEDEDGEVIRKYDIGPPSQKKREGSVATGLVNPEKSRARMYRMGSYLGVKPKNTDEPQGDDVEASKDADNKGKGRGNDDDDNDDDGVRFTFAGGRRMSKAEFIQQIQRMDPKSRVKIVENADVPETVKEEARADAREQDAEQRQGGLRVPAPRPALGRRSPSDASTNSDSGVESRQRPDVRRAPTAENAPSGPGGLTLTTSDDEDVPLHDITGDVQRHHSAQMNSGQETSAQRRRREAYQRTKADAEDSDDDGTPRVPPRPRYSSPGARRPSGLGRMTSDNDEETAAERRRRERALGIAQDSDDSDSDSGPTGPASRSKDNASSSRIRFAEDSPSSGSASGPQETAADRRRRLAILATHTEPSVEEEVAPEEELVSPASTRSANVRFAEEPARQGETAAARRRRLAAANAGGGQGGQGRYGSRS